MKKKKRFRINGHIIVLLFVVGCIAFAFYRIRNWHTEVPPASGLIPYPIGDIDDTEVLDNMVPIQVPADQNPANDDELQIVFFGNSPFADSRNDADGVVNLIKEKTGATVYNCSVSNSYLAASQYSFFADKDPMDAFNLYWLMTLVCMDNHVIYQQAFDAWGSNAPADCKEVYETLCKIDFNKVDAVAIMYDAADYLAGRPFVQMHDETVVQTWADNLNASLDLFMQTYPHIRFIVMSPTYAYAIGEDGSYVDSDVHKVDGVSLSTYAGNVEQSAYLHSMSYVDNIYGTVTSENASQYLTDNVHLNAAGRKKLADRFIYALKYFD